MASTAGKPSRSKRTTRPRSTGRETGARRSRNSGSAGTKVRKAPRQRQPARLDRRTRAARRDGTSSRQRLLDAAARVFSERGYEAASVDEIAAEAGVSKGTLYWNFENKDDLFLALVEEHHDSRVREIVAATESTSADEDMAPKASRWLGDLLQEERQLILLLHEYSARAVRDPKLRARHAERVAALRDSLAAALDARAAQLGAPKFSMPTKDIAMAFIALAQGLSFQRLLDRDSVPDYLFGEILALVYQGLVARAEREAST